MAEKYDIAVVGAGLGGLSVSTFLAKKGFKVVLLERHNVPGGYATSFVRGRYEFETALHELSDVGGEDMRGVLGQYLRYLGVDEKVEFVSIPNLYRSIFPGLDMTLPVGREAYVSTLCDAFPQQEKGIRRFMERVFSLAKEVDGLSELQKARSPLKAAPLLAALPFKLRAIPRYMFSTWGEVMARDIDDERARAVISQYWGYLGLPPGKISFFYFALALASYVANGASHIKGRSQALSNAFVERFRELGGDARFNCGVESILTVNGKTSGVLTEDGEEIAADIVVSNADPITTCQDMIGLDRVPASYFKKLRSCEVAPSSFNVYMGVDKSPEDLHATEHEIFMNANYDHDSHYEKFFKFEAPDQMVVTCYNSVLPEISPPGTSMVVLTTLGYGNIWYDLDPQKYFETKNEIADKMIDMAETIMPGLRDAIEVVEVSTPLTNMRYAGTMGGSIYGFNNTPFNHTILRPSALGPLKGLYFVGAWVQPGGGYSPAMMSGQIAGEIINARYKNLLGRN